MAKIIKFGVVKAYIDELKVRATVQKSGTDTKFQIELAYEDYPDVRKNVDAFASYLADKIEQVLEE